MGLGDKNEEWWEIGDLGVVDSPMCSAFIAIFFINSGGDNFLFIFNRISSIIVFYPLFLAVVERNEIWVVVVLQVNYNFTYILISSFGKWKMLEFSKKFEILMWHMKLVKCILLCSSPLVISKIILFSKDGIDDGGLVVVIVYFFPVNR